MTRSSPAADVRVPPAGRYVIDPETSAVSFSVKYMFGIGTARGTFAIREGGFTVADPVAQSSAWATIDTRTFDTGNAKRDKDVRSAKLLDADMHPDITFSSASSAEVDLGAPVLRGSLTVHGVTRPVELRIVSSSATDAGARVRATTRVDRYEFGVTAAKGMAGRYLDITIDIVGAQA